ncbi:hypothetical protein MTBBW1_1770023 [Desulfamplus magnetovallimortis]|uniref:Uncharacterized protein n=1 Tax=Desulfamplus magnetovallimortis TaxID=1246637 RepID=A0A1W1HAD6_9BACT|nr:AAA family ATPase [Desulfamplus magnetovallimortis]SLM29365.1 hypothetical protein MTBBW1_1770023 [Desulfamplus magnetovallimortis]
MQNFGVLKGIDVMPLLRLVFITGVSKFSQVSIFSELNNLTDLTMHREYADMMGYTRNELEKFFNNHIQAFAIETGEDSDSILDKLRLYYDGIRFSEKDIRVYNPYSVILSLDEKRFKKYWFETDTPTFLINLLKEEEWHFRHPSYHAESTLHFPEQAARKIGIVFRKM